MAPNIPDRWIPYSPVGSVIEGTRLICFKVPLRKNVLEGCIKNGAKIDEIWDIDTLLKRVPKLKFVIDLTNTARYYDARVFEAAGVEHVKLPLPGRVIPPEAIVKLFHDTVERFLGKDDEGLIGVHCTHGLNRTGFMVCRYLRDRLGMTPDKAIEIFEVARGYKIERENYLADIRGSEPPPPDFSQDTRPKAILTDGQRPYGRWHERAGYGDVQTGYGDGRPSRYGRERSRSRERDRSPLREESKGQRRRPDRNPRRQYNHGDSSSSRNHYDYRYDY